jgi:hypothetical protein
VTYEEAVTHGEKHTMKQVNNIKKIYGSCCAGQRVKKILREEDVQNVSPRTKS